MSRGITQGYVTEIGHRETNGRYGPGYQYFLTLDNGIKVSINGKQNDNGKPDSPCGKSVNDGKWTSIGVGDYIEAVYTQNGQYYNGKSSDTTVHPQGVAPYTVQGTGGGSAPAPSGGPTPAQRPAQSNSGGNVANGKVHGATVGMAINNAVSAFVGGKISEQDIPSFSSRLLRLASALESGRVFEQSQGGESQQAQPTPQPQAPVQQPAPQQAPSPAPAPAQAPAPEPAPVAADQFADTDGFDDDIPF